MLKLPFANKIIGFAGERAFNFGEFYRERGDDSLGLADQLRL